jgi:hypothetical protein
MPTKFFDNDIVTFIKLSNEHPNDDKVDLRVNLTEDGIIKGILKINGTDITVEDEEHSKCDDAVKKYIETLCQSENTVYYFARNYPPKHSHYGYDQHFANHMRRDALVEMLCRDIHDLRRSHQQKACCVIQ